MKHTEKYHENIYRFTSLCYITVISDVYISDVCSHCFTSLTVDFCVICSFYKQLGYHFSQRFQDYKKGEDNINTNSH